MDDNDLEKSWSQLLEETSWAKLSHAYGPATDTPGHLRALVKGSADERKAADNHLFSAIMHQGTPWAATSSVVLVIMAILRDGAVVGQIRPSRDGMLAFLTEVEDCLNQLSEDDWRNVERMAGAIPEDFQHIGEWDAVEGSAELADGYFAYAGLALRRLWPGMRACLADYGR